MEQKTEASQAASLPFPPMPLPVVKHAVIGDLFDCFALQQYAMRYADLVVAALKAQPAPTEPQDEKKPFAWAYRAIGSGDWRATMDYKWAHAIEGMETKPLYDFPTEAAQGAQLSGNSGQLQPSGNTGELAQGEDSARLDAERYRWLCEKFGVTWLPCFLEDKLERGYIEDGKVSIDAVIDRARASAETGGVKS